MFGIRCDPRYSIEDPGRLRYAECTSCSELKIPAKAGIVHRLIEVYVEGAPNKSTLTIRVGPRDVFVSPAVWHDLKAVSELETARCQMSLMALVRQVFGDDYLVEARQFEDISIVLSGTASRIVALYEELVGAEVDASKPLRSGSEVQVGIFPITHTATINASGRYSFDDPKVPPGWFGPKDGVTIPANRELVIRGIAVGSVANVGTKPTYFHLLIDNYEYFTPYSLTGVSIDPAANLLRLDVTQLYAMVLDPITVKPGQKLGLQFDATYDGANSIAAGEIVLGIIAEYRPPRA